MTNIADAIREKTGETGLLTLDAMAAAIAAIEAGGGGGGGGAVAAWGEIKPASKTSVLEIEHGLGVVPQFAVIIHAPTYSRENNQILYAYNDGDGGGVFCRTSSSSSYGSSGSSHDITAEGGSTGNSSWGWGAWGANEKTIKFGVNITSSYGFKSGAPYYWIVAGGKEE